MKSLAPFAGWSALVMGFLALMAYLIVPDILLWSLTFGLVAAINAIFFLAVDRQAVVRALKTRTALYGMNATVVIFVFLGILIFINLLTHRHKYSWDLTETSFFTLSPQTRKIAANLPRKIKMTAFYATGIPQRKDFQRLADGYKEVTDQIEVEFVDPDRQPAITRQYGVTTYGTVVLESGTQVVKIKEATEENLTNALLRVTRDGKKKIYFLSGHNERSIKSQDKKGYSQAKESLEKDNYAVEELLLLQTGTVPDDADVLIINGPEKVLQESEIQAVQAYLSRGGAVLLLLDPQQDAGLKSFLEDWGVEIRDDLVIDPLAKLFGADYTTPIVSQVADHPITREMRIQTIFPMLRSVQAITSQELKTTELLFSGERSWAEKDYLTGKVKLDPGIDLQGPVAIAVAVSKTLPAGDASSPSEESGDSVPEKQAHLVVFGDSDFASNQYLSLYGNGDLFLNAASWLSKEENLISIRPRNRKWSPIVLTESQGNITFLLGTLVFPSVVVLLGLRVWWKRRSL